MVYVISKEFDDFWIGQGKFYYRPVRKIKKMWQEHPYIYGTKSAAMKALKRINDPDAVLEIYNGC